MIYRTLRESQALHDYSNQSLRFNRTLKDAGWADELSDDDYHPEACIVWGVGALVVVVVGVLVWLA